MRKIRSKSAVSFVYRVAKFGPYEHFFKRIFHPLCLLCAFFLACTKKKRHRAYSHAVLDSIFIPGFILELNLMTLR